jgi:hypothetical protein
VIEKNLIALRQLAFNLCRLRHFEPFNRSLA